MQTSRHFYILINLDQRGGNRCAMEAPINPFSSQSTIFFGEFCRMQPNPYVFRRNFKFNLEIFIFSLPRIQKELNYNEKQISLLRNCMWGEKTHQTAKRFSSVLFSPYIIFFRNVLNKGLQKNIYICRLKLVICIYTKL